MKYKIQPLAYWLTVVPDGERLSNEGMIIPKSATKHEFLRWRVTGVGHMAGCNSETACAESTKVGDLILAEENKVNKIEHNGQVFYMVDEAQTTKLIPIEE